MALDGWMTFPNSPGSEEIWIGQNFGAVVVPAGQMFHVNVWLPTRKARDKYFSSIEKAKEWGEVQLVAESLAPRTAKP